MASKERIQRLKDDTRCNILNASLQIVKEEGWPSLSMRKIADKIEYTAPIIYEYFSNKEAILQQLTLMGFMQLGEKIEAACKSASRPEAQLEAMWMAYWNFALSEKELYQVMFGVQMSCCLSDTPCPGRNAVSTMISTKIEELVPVAKRTKNYIARRYLTFWSVIHGLVSINLTNQATSKEMNRQVLKDAIDGMINAIKT